MHYTAKLLHQLFAPHIVCIWIEPQKFGLPIHCKQEG